MNLGLVIIVIFLLICILLFIMEVKQSIKRKSYIDRKEHDQRVFNPIREKAWWK